MQLTELSTEYFLGEAAASVASMVATPLLCILSSYIKIATIPGHEISQTSDIHIKGQYLLTNVLVSYYKGQLGLYSYLDSIPYIGLFIVTVNSCKSDI